MTYIEVDFNKDIPLKTAELHLPYFKQGDDLNHCLENNKSNYKALIANAENLEYAASILREMAVAIAPYDEMVEIEADTHLILLTGPKEIMESLVGQKIDGLSFPEWLDEEEEDDYDEDDENFEDEEDLENKEEQ